MAEMVSSLDVESTERCTLSHGRTSINTFIDNLISMLSGSLRVRLGLRCG